MHERTVKRTRIGAFVSWLAGVLLRVLGWRVDAEFPPVNKCIIIAAPHTTAWDLFYALLGALTVRVPICFMIKDTVFWWPLSAILYRLGGIPVNRRERTSAVEQMAEAFRQCERLYLIITPEGTRKGTPYWKTGFYWIAHQAGVPIWLCYINYGDKVMRGGPFLRATGDIEADFGRIRAFYEAVFGPMPNCRPAPREHQEEQQRKAC